MAMLFRINFLLLNIKYSQRPYRGVISNGFPKLSQKKKFSHATRVSISSTISIIQIREAKLLMLWMYILVVIEFEAYMDNL